MNSFKAVCKLITLGTDIQEDVVITSKQDIIDLMGGSAGQVHIDKFHKVYYAKNEQVNGVSAWVDTYQYYDETDGWVNDEGKDYVCGDKLLLVLCDDEVPVNITKDEVSFIISCINM